MEGAATFTRYGDSMGGPLGMTPPPSPPLTPRTSAVSSRITNIENVVQETVQQVNKIQVELGIVNSRYQEVAMEIKSQVEVTLAQERLTTQESETRATIIPTTSPTRRAEPVGPATPVQGDQCRDQQVEGEDAAVGAPQGNRSGNDEPERGPQEKTAWYCSKTSSLRSLPANRRIGGPGSKRWLISLRPIIEDFAKCLNELSA